MDQSPRFNDKLQHAAGRVEMVSGCGLEEDTTTSLKALGHDFSKQTILDSLTSNTDCLSRELSK